MISPSGRVENLCCPILLRNSQNIADFPLLMIFLFRGVVSPARRFCFMPGGAVLFFVVLPAGASLPGCFSRERGAFPVRDAGDIVRGCSRVSAVAVTG